MIKHYNIIRRY